MKKIYLITFFLLNIGCDKDKSNNKICDCNNKINPIEVVNVEGVINFNEDIQEWYVSVHKENTYDMMQLFIFCNIEDSYKTVNKKVLFSGTSFDLATKINAPAGSDYTCMDISFMSDIP
ncbi:MAG: hypothetical protein LBD91_03595 [Prevotellaceae bacterium]|jgi:hypothetical protein|nr:hypothetical protein [Prevotellaceae bacterium]